MDQSAQEEPIVSENSDNTITLAMSILVRDEVDIIEHNIRYHAAMGVSHFVVTDNGSKDGTRELLEQLSKELSLTIIDEPSHTIDQDLWVTRMAGMIKADGRYDWIIHNDADEFWRPHNGHNLPSAIHEALNAADKIEGHVGVLSCSRINMVGSIEDSQAPDYRFYHNKHEVKKEVPIAEGEPQWNKQGTNTVARSVLDKVMTRTEGLGSVGYGNHEAEHQQRSVQCHTVKIYHFPVRTYHQFEKKVKNYGESLQQNDRFREGASSHLRHWYRRYLEGYLMQDYQAIAFTKARLEDLTQEGYLEPTSVIESFFSPESRFDKT